MGPLPPFLAVRYRIATAREIRSWSFGQVHSRRELNATHWQAQRGTIDDQQIFGPLKEGACACGKYHGTQHRGMICDLCGVKLTSPSVRRERFGHIEFEVELRHPFGQAADLLPAFPVLPAVYVGSSSGCRLAECYESLLDDMANPTLAQQCLDRLAELLLPVIISAHEWRLVEAPRLAQGLALALRESMADDVD